MLDITMPQLDGVEALRRIMGKDKNARVIIVSSIGHKEMVWKAICLGAESFVTKPYTRLREADHSRRDQERPGRGREMRYEYIGPFVSTTMRVLHDAVRSPITREDVTVLQGDRIQGEVAVAIRITGDSEGDVIIRGYDEHPFYRR